MGKNYCKVDHHWCKFARHRGCIWASRSGIPFKLLHRCPSRESRETVCVREFLKSLPMSDLIDRVAGIGNGLKGTAEEWVEALMYIMSLKPGIRSDIQVKVITDTHHVYGITRSREALDLSFYDWSEWVTMNITRKTLSDFSENPVDLGVAILTEMCYFGTTPESPKAAREEASLL